MALQKVTKQGRNVYDVLAVYNGLYLTIQYQGECGH